MPLQNRVTPFGALERSAARGLFMGNRGILHDTNKQLGRARWKHPHWIVCVLEFKNRRRELMAPGRYTELFFCDEAVALAAGHRPCAECRRADFGRYAAAWEEAHCMAGGTARAAAMDAALQRSRVRRDGTQVRYAASPGDLPDGSFVALPDEPAAAWLVHAGALHRWSHAGYTERRTARGMREAAVLTPAPTVAALRAGYRPKLHPGVAA